jgi:hypothetical protein
MPARSPRYEDVTVALIIGGLVAIAAVVIVALPFLREPLARDDHFDPPSELQQRLLAVAEERDRALAALKELEFDHRTGKISDDDYRALVGPLRRRAADALRALEPRAAASREGVRPRSGPGEGVRWNREVPPASREEPDDG